MKLAFRRLVCALKRRHKYPLRVNWRTCRCLYCKREYVA
jgi:hypothetical protein